MTQRIKSILRRWRNNMRNLNILFARFRRNNMVKIDGAYLRNVRVSIKGIGNTLFIHPSCQLVDSHISLSCNNSSVIISGGGIFQ